MVEKLTINYLEQIEEIIKEQFGNEGWTRSQIESAFNNKSVSFYGIVKNNILISFASILESLDDINIIEIATRSSYKRQGYAKKILTFLVSLKNDDQTMSLEVKSKNMPAISLYTSFGFKTLHIRKKYYKNGDDALCMFL